MLDIFLVPSFSLWSSFPRVKMFSSIWVKCISRMRAKLWKHLLFADNDQMLSSLSKIFFDLSNLRNFTVMSSVSTYCTFQNHSVRWLDYAKLPLNVNKCENVCAWCLVYSKLKSSVPQNTVGYGSIATMTRIKQFPKVNEWKCFMYFC